MSNDIIAWSGIAITIFVGIVNFHLRIQKNSILISELQKDVEEFKLLKNDVQELKSMIRELKGTLTIDMTYIKDTIARHEKKIE